MAREKRATKKNGKVSQKVSQKGSEITPALEFMQLLWAIDHGLHAMSKRMGKTLGVTGPQRLVVRLVGTRPGITAGELADMLCVHPSTLTGVFDRLCARGFLARTRDPSDRRLARFTLTAKGLKVDRARTGTIESIVAKALEKTSSRDVVAARRVLAVVTEQLGGAQPAPLREPPSATR